MLFIALRGLCTWQNKVSPRAGELQEITGLPRQSLWRATRELCARGLIVTDTTNGITHLHPGFCYRGYADAIPQAIRQYNYMIDMAPSTVPIAET